MDHLVEDDYRTLLQFRTELRRFLHWSEQQARDAAARYGASETTIRDHEAVAC